MESKRCSKCGVVKPFSDFHKRSVSPDGKDTKCKICRSVYTSRIPTGLADAPLKDRKYAEHVLRSIGYVLYGEESVYSQFKRRMEEKGIDTSEWD